MPLSKGSKILAITAAGAGTGPSGDQRLVILVILGGCVRTDTISPGRRQWPATNLHSRDEVQLTMRLTDNLPGTGSLGGS
jgi:hypothetical protein